MEVVMGRCFPLTGPVLPQGTSVPVVKGVVYKSEKPSPTTRGSNSVSKKETHAVEVETVKADSPPRQSHPPPHQNGVIPNSKQPVILRDKRPAKNEVDVNSAKTRAVEVHADDRPKTHSILRRTSSRGTEDATPPSALQTTDPKENQDTARQRELSRGQQAWEVTQKRKAQMREEFFKVPYEECNREAARSLGGRLNKSEPRLHTVGKERKKRNSLSYKRRVHFDLDYDEHEEDKPRLRSRSFEAPPAPVKVVVSIYSIDDKPKRVIQPDALKTPDANEDALSRPCQANTRAKNARPTDLDSLQQKLAADKTLTKERPEYTEQRRIRSSSLAREVPHVTSRTDNNLKSAGWSSVSVSRGHSAPTTPTLTTTSPPASVPQGPSVRPRHRAPVMTPSTPSRSVASWPQYHTAKTPPPSSDESKEGPVPAPRSHLTRTPQQDHSHHSPPTQLPLPRSDHLQISSPHQATGHIFTPTKTFIRPQTATAIQSPPHPSYTLRPTSLGLTAPSTTCSASQVSSAPHTPTASHTATSLSPTVPHTLTAPRTHSAPHIPTSQSPTVPHIPTAPHTHSAPHIPSSHPPTVPNTPTAPYTPTSHSPTVPHTPTTPESTTCSLYSTAPIPKPRKRISVSQQTVTPQSTPSATTKVSHSHTPPHHNHTTPHYNHTTPHHNHTHTHITDENSASHNIPARLSTTPTNNVPQNTTVIDYSNKTVYPEKSKRENGTSKSRKKTDKTERGNSVNILMTKGESYSKHNIIINSHLSSVAPSVTVRKVLVPVSTPARCSPSPTPSCASSSCSLGSSGSSSGCFSGSPSPTPTPSPTRIRASGVPTDL